MVCRRCEGGSSSQDYWRPTPLDISVVSYDRIGSKRKFGVEIETSRCGEYRNLCGRTHWGAKDDCTVSGMEFDSPVLYGDAGLEQIEEILAFGHTHGWEVDNYCGCHTHYDMRDENKDQLLSIMYAYRKSIGMWGCFVPSRRSSSSYCSMPTWCPGEMRSHVDGRSHETFTAAIRNMCLERYEMVNFTAYFSHTTFEVRMLEGTVDPGTICKWLTIHCRFMDAVRDLSLNELDGIFNSDYAGDFETLANFIGDSDLIDWLESRQIKFNNRPRYRR